MLDIFLISFLVIAFIRNFLLLRIRINALELVSIFAQKAISENKKNWVEFHVLLDSYGGYLKMFLSVWKWSFNGFYPDLEKRCSEILEGM